jgi:hypothetical protein
VTPGPSLIALFVAPLNRARIEYMVTGGLAAIAYGHPRLTVDVDLVIRLTDRDASAFSTLWPADEFYSPPPEVVEEERKRSSLGHCNVIHNATSMHADVYFVGTDELGAWGLQHRVVRQVQGEDVQFAPIEYVIANKLRYFQMGGSDRHLRDIARMLEVSDAEVDQSALLDWITRLGLSPAWEKAQTYRGRE